ncbi:hypothetical protein GN956_G2857 [Arapaima gigas]
MQVLPAQKPTAGGRTVSPAIATVDATGCFCGETKVSSLLEDGLKYQTSVAVLATKARDRPPCTRLYNFSLTSSAFKLLSRSVKIQGVN